MVRVPAAEALAGTNVTEIEQVAPAAKLAQLLVSLKLVAPELEVLAAGVLIWSVAPLVLPSVTLCWVEALPGTFEKTSDVGLSERPGSARPYPVSVAEADTPAACSVSVPVRGPAADGAKTIST